jgi:hypothetical protein
MSQTYYQRCSFLVPMRWLRAGDDLFRPDHVDQCADCPLMRSRHPPRCPLHALRLPCVQACRSPRASVAPTIEVRADIKSP